MGDTVIRVENLSKKYVINHQATGGYSTLRDQITEGAQSISRFLIPGKKHERPSREEFWALKDVSFEVKQGDRVGIIGRNGAGKSTLLKILSRITEPTQGEIAIKGRVASLLEVGTGFHPELTGRENIFLNGAILGMSKLEIKRKFDEIVDFAEIEKFLDTPVKRYSSGMYVRLAFAVAAHLEPEILVVDEVLAVGDIQFQKKCLGKMSDITEEGRTLLFVSHNLLAIEDLCNHLIWLDNGGIAEEGDPNRVISSYIKPFLATNIEKIWSKSSIAPGNDNIRLHRVSVRPLKIDLVKSITVSTPFILEFEYWNFNSSNNISLCFCLYNEQDILVFDICSPSSESCQKYSSMSGLLKSICHIPSHFLNDGLYRVDLKITENHVVVIDQPGVLIFSVGDSSDQREGCYEKWPGVLRPLLNWELNVPIKDHSSAID